MSDNTYNSFTPGASASVSLTADGSLSTANIGQLSELLPNGTVRAYTPLTLNIPFTQVADFHQTGNNAWTPDLSPNQNYLYCADQGIPALWTYSVDDSGAITNLQEVTLSYTPAVTEITTGAWSSDSSYYYLLTQDNSGPTPTGHVLVFSVDGGGNATQIQDTPIGLGSTNYGQIVMHPSGNWMYATSTSDNTIQAFSRNPSTGMLTLVGSAVPSGQFPQYINFDSTGHYLYVSNQDATDYSINWYGINQSTGALIASVITVQVNITSVSGTANPEDVFTDITSGATGVVVGNMQSSLNYFFVTITSGTISPGDLISTSSGLTATVSSTVSAGNPFNGGTNPRAMDIRTYGGTQYLYWTNKDNFVGVASINPSTGALTQVQLMPTTDTGNAPGEGPAISPNGLWLYNCNFNSNTTDQFAINQSTGLLSIIAPATQDNIGAHNCLAVSPDNSYLALTSEGTNIIQIYAIDSGSGALTLIANITPSGSGSNGELPIFRSDGTVMYSAYNDSGDLYSFTLAPVSVSPYLSLGKIVGVDGGIAYMDSGQIQTFIAAENISAGAPVAGTTNGQVKNQGPLDKQIGICFAAVTTGNLAIIILTV